LSLEGRRNGKTDFLVRRGSRPRSRLIDPFGLWADCTIDLCFRIPFRFSFDLSFGFGFSFGFGSSLSLGFGYCVGLRIAFWFFFGVRSLLFPFQECSEVIGAIVLLVSSDLFCARFVSTTGSTPTRFRFRQRGRRSEWLGSGWEWKGKGLRHAGAPSKNKMVSSVTSTL